MQRAVLVPVTLASILSAAVALAVGVLVYPPLSRAAQEAPPGAAQVPTSVIRAERIEVIDAQGALRLRLGVEPSGAANVVVYDQTGRLRLVAGLADDGQPVLGFWDAAGQPRLGAGMAPDGSPSIGVRNEQGQTIWQAPPAPSQPNQPAPQR